MWKTSASYISINLSPIKLSTVASPRPRSHLTVFHSSVSRLAGMDQAIHKLNVGHYTLDVKVSQLMDRLSRMDGKTITSSHESSHDGKHSSFFMNLFSPSLCSIFQ